MSDDLEKPARPAFTHTLTPDSPHWFGTTLHQRITGRDPWEAARDKFSRVEAALARMEAEIQALKAEIAKKAGA